MFYSTRYPVNITFQGAAAQLSHVFLGSVNIRQYLLRPRQIIVKYFFSGIITLAFDTRIGLYEDPPKDEALKMSELIREHLDLSQKLIFNIVSRFASQYIETPTLKKFYKCADASFDMGLALIDKKMRELKEMEEKGILASGDNQGTC